MSGIMNMFVATKTTIATAVDAFFNSVSLLLNTSSTNGAQNNTFLDSSTNNFSITRNGNTSQGTFTPFSQTGWSNYLNGSSYLQTPSSTNYAFGTGDFTIEAFFFPTATTANIRLFEFSDNNDNIGANFTSTGTIGYYNGSTNTVSAGTPFTANQWNHVAIVRSSGTVTVYVNGTSALTQASTPNTTSARSVGIAGISNTYFPGYVSNVRILKGTAQYTATFTPPTAPLTAITNTQLLTCQSNRFIDNSTNAVTLTIGSAPQVQAFSPFLPTAAYDAAVVGGSGYFDGTGDYLSIASNAAFTFTGDFTWEGWFYMTANPSQTYSARLIDYNGGSNLLVFSTSDGTDYLGFAVAGTTYTTTTALPRRQWAHVAISRSGTGSNNLKLFLNGTAVSTQTNTSTVTAANIYISNRPSGDGYFTGYIGSYRMTNTGLYTTTFTPATSPFTAVTGTALLLNYTNAGIYDSAAKNVLETVGNAQVSTTQAKWGTTSMKFDGTDDYLISSNAVGGSVVDISSGNFTLEAWVYLNTAVTVDTQTILQWFINTGSSNSTITFTIHSSAGLRFLSIDSAGNVIVNASQGAITGWSTGTWYHVAAVRNGNVYTVYRDGTSLATTTVSGSLATTTKLWVGASNFTGANGGLNGYLDDVRITKGYARYTANFTPPTAAFGTQ